MWEKTSNKSIKLSAVAVAVRGAEQGLQMELRLVLAHGLLACLLACLPACLPACPPRYGAVTSGLAVMYSVRRGRLILGPWGKGRCDWLALTRVRISSTSNEESPNPRVMDDSAQHPFALGWGSYIDSKAAGSKNCGSCKQLQLSWRRS